MKLISTSSFNLSKTMIKHCLRAWHKCKSSPWAAGCFSLKLTQTVLTLMAGNHHTHNADSQIDTQQCTEINNITSDKMSQRYRKNIKYRPLTEASLYQLTTRHFRPTLPFTSLLVVNCFPRTTIINLPVFIRHYPIFKYKVWNLFKSMSNWTLSTTLRKIELY